MSDDAPFGFRSREAHGRLKSRAWAVGLFTGFLQVVMPIAVIVAGFATLVSACKQTLEGPRVHASGAAVHQGRVWFTTNASAGENKRRVLLMSVDPKGGAPRMERELTGGKTNLFSDTPTLRAAGGKLWMFSDKALLDDAGKEIAKFPDEGTAGVPFVHQGKPAIPMSDSRGVKLFAYDGSWTRIGGLTRELDGEVNKSRIQVLFSGDRPRLFTRSYSDVVYEIHPKGNMERHASDASDFAVASTGEGPRLFYVTNGPGLDELLDSLEDDAPRKENPTKLVALDLSRPGEKPIAAVRAAGADQVAVLPIDGALHLGSEADDGLDLRAFAGTKIGPAVEAHGDPMWQHKVSLIGLTLLWFGGGALITLLASWMMASAMAKHRSEDQVATHASLTRRAVARLIDTALIVAVVAGVMFGLGADAATLAQMLGVLVAILLVVIEGHTGGSPGKWALGIRVQTPEGQPPGIWAAFLRSMLMGVDGLFGGLVGVMTAAFSPSWQRVGDQAAKTVVVRTATS